MAIENPPSALKIAHIAVPKNAEEGLPGKGAQRVGKPPKRPLEGSVFSKGGSASKNARRRGDRQEKEGGLAWGKGRHQGEGAREGSHRRGGGRGRQNARSDTM